MITINATGSDGTSVLLKTLDGSVAEPLLATLAASPSVASNALGTLATFSAKAAAGNLVSVRATNANVALRYLQIKNKAAALAAGDVPDYSIPLPAGTATNPAALVLDNGFFSTAGIAFAVGIAIGVSTTQGTFTAATAADHSVYVHYV